MNGRVSLGIIRQVNEDDMHLRFNQALEVAKILDLNQAESMIKSCLKDRDSCIQASVQELQKLFSAKELDSERILEAIDELDLFAFTPFKIGKRTTNCLLESLRLGLDDVATSIFSESLDNLRAALIPNDDACYELNPDSQADLSFFEHSRDLNKKAYFLVIDLVDLRAFEVLFARRKVKAEFIEFVLSDSKFKSLFQASPESQQESLVRVIGYDHESLLSKKPYGKVYRKLRKLANDQQPIAITEIDVFTVVDPLQNE